MLMASWSGQLGPVRGLLQGNGIVGAGARRHGGVTGIPGRMSSQRAYDILAGAAVAYAEVDLGMVRPFVAGIFGTPDSDPTDRQLRGFAQPLAGRDADYGGHVV